MGGKIVTNDNGELGPAEAEVHEPTPGRNFDPDRHREIIRNILAITVAGLLVVVLLMRLVAVTVAGTPWSKLQGVVGAIVPGVIGIAGTILGFYFGTRGKQ